MNNNQEFSLASLCVQKEDESGRRYENQDNKLSDVEKSNEEFTTANISTCNSSAIPCSSIPMIHSTSERSIDPHERMVISITGKPSSERKSKDKSIKFPSKLMYLLECGDYDDIVCWSPDGQSFTIKNAKAFESIILPEIFKQAKLSSFLRKLYRWGFVKSQSESRQQRGKDEASFTHPLFCSGNNALCMNMPSSKKANHMKRKSEREIHTFKTSSSNTGKLLVSSNNDKLEDESYPITSVTPHGLNLEFSSCQLLQRRQSSLSQEWLRDLKEERSSFNQQSKDIHYSGSNRSSFSLHGLDDSDTDRAFLNQIKKIRIGDPDVRMELSTDRTNQDSLSLCAIEDQATDSFYKCGRELMSMNDVYSINQGHSYTNQSDVSHFSSEDYRHIFDSVFQVHLNLEGQKNK